MGLFLLLLSSILPHTHHRYLTRWPHRLVFALAIALLLAAVWRIWQAQLCWLFQLTGLGRIDKKWIIERSILAVRALFITIRQMHSTKVSYFCQVLAGPIAP
jgi:hypothetical protein